MNYPNPPLPEFDLSAWIDEEWRQFAHSEAAMRAYGKACVDADREAQQERDELLSEVERLRGILAMNEMAFNNNKFVLSQAENEIELLRERPEHKHTEAEVQEIVGQAEYGYSLESVVRRILGVH